MTGFPEDEGGSCGYVHPPSPADADDPLLSYADIATIMTGRGLAATAKDISEQHRQHRMPRPDEFPTPDRPLWRQSTVEAWLAGRDEERLATYNSEVARGETGGHTPELMAEMAALQFQFNAEPHPAGDGPILTVSSTIRVRCQICGAEGVGSVMHRKGCGGSTPEKPLIAIGYERLGPDGEWLP